MCRGPQRPRGPHAAREFETAGVEGAMRHVWGARTLSTVASDDSILSASSVRCRSDAFVIVCAGIYQTVMSWLRFCPSITRMMSSWRCL